MNRIPFPFWKKLFLGLVLTVWTFSLFWFSSNANYFYNYDISKSNDEIPNMTEPVTFSKLVDDNKNNLSNVIDYTNIKNNIISQSTILPNQLPFGTKTVGAFYEEKNPYITNGFEDSAEIAFKKWIIGFWWRVVVNQYAPKTTLIFPFMNIFMPAQKIPILIHVSSNKFSNDANIKTKVFISNKEFQVGRPSDLDNISIVAETEFEHKNNSVGYTVLDIKKIFDDNVIPQKGSVFLYTYSVDGNWHKTTVEKRKIDYIASDLELTATVWDNVIEFDRNNRKEYWTRWEFADINVYSNMELRSIKSSEYTIAMLENEVLNPEKNINGLNYDHLYKIRVMGLKEGENDIPLTWLSVFWAQKNANVTVFRDSTPPEAIKYWLTDEFKIEKDSIIYINTPNFKKKGSFDMILHPDDWEGIGTQEVIVKTELGKKIYPLTDKQENTLDHLQIKNTNGDRIFVFEISDMLWNTRVLEYRFRYLDVSFPIFLYPSQNNVIVVDNQINFIGFCSGITDGQIKYKLNNGDETDWVEYKETWSIPQILQRWNNVFAIKCKNIVWLESDWWERNVIYSPITRLWWTNSLLQIYSTLANGLFMNRANKNVNNDSLQVITPDMKTEIPWFQK